MLCLILAILYLVLVIIIVYIKNKKRNIIIIIVLIIIVLVWLIWENNSIAITNIKYSNNKLPNEFNEYRIVHISDIHIERFGKNQKKLLSKIEKCNADIIVVTGDLVDKSKNVDIAIEFMSHVAKIAPVYYVVGNHEVYTKEYRKIRQELIDAKVIVLDNESVTLSKNGQSINLIGLLDPNFYVGSYEDRRLRINNELKELLNNEHFKILLSHRPELMDLYVDNNIDLVLTGHTHGGHIRFPIIGGVIAPNQGLFPKYIDGIYEERNTAMVVNRGIGGNAVVPRVFNMPEIILLELQTVNTED